MLVLVATIGLILLRGVTTGKASGSLSLSICLRVISCFMGLVLLEVFTSGIAFDLVGVYDERKTYLRF